MTPDNNQQNTPQNPQKGSGEVPKESEFKPVPRIDNSALRKQPAIPRTENINPKPVETAAPTPKDGLIPVAAQVQKGHQGRAKSVDPNLPAAVAAKPMQRDNKGNKENMSHDKQSLITKKKKKKQSKKMFALVSVFLIGIVALFSVAFLLIYSVTDPSNNPFIQLFGLEVEQWIPFLINLISVFFGFLVLVSFFVGLIGVFKIGAAKKDDKAGKKKGMAMAMLGSMLLIVFIITWMFTYIWLDGKKSEYAPQIELIQTIPTVVTQLTAPLVIKFDASEVEARINQRQTEILSYVWTFGDGQKQTGKIVSHEYLRKGEVDGSYDVTLRLRYRDIKTGEEGTQDFHRTIVFDNEKVAASFTSSIDKGPFPLDVEFDASESSDPDGSIIAYEWDFDGDGDFDDGAGQKVNYTFSQIGEYNVQLKVVDNSNDFAITERLITVTESLEPKVVIDVDSDSGNYYINKEYTFDGSGSTSPSGAIVKYNWDFGDGTKATTRTVSHTFKKLGTYIIILETEDIEKRRSISSIEIEVKKPDSPPRAIITPNPDFTDSKRTYVEGTAPFSVSLNALASTDEDDDIIDYEWDFDSDGNIDASGDIGTFTYNSPGEYKAVLYVTDAAGNATSQTLTVKVEKQGLKARISASSLEGEVPHVVMFDASSSAYPEGRIISYKWDFGDGSNPRFDDSQIAYEYTRVGEFSANVIVKTDDGLEKTANVLINIRPVSVQGCFNMDHASGDVPLEVVFDSSCSTGTITQYTWKINGITTPSTPQHRLTHTFEDAGMYEVELTVRDHDGVIDSYTETVNVSEAE